MAVLSPTKRSIPWVTVGVGLFLVVVIGVVAWAITKTASCCRVRPVHYDTQESPEKKEDFCGQCAGGEAGGAGPWTGSLSPPTPYPFPTRPPQKDCPSLGSYQFEPCKCFGAQGAAVNPPRPFDSPLCGSCPAMSAEESLTTQTGCLRNTFDFPGRGILGVS